MSSTAAATTTSIMGGGSGAHGTGAAGGIGILEPLLNSPHIVGAAWMVSSALFTTYSTTKFLKYKAPPLSARSMSLRKDPTSSTASSLSASFLSSLSRPTILTLARFGGSLLLGLLAHPDVKALERLRETVAVAQHFALPAFFLYVANYMNSISLDRIGISLTYTSKCGIPLMTVLLTMLLEGVHHLPSPPALASLIPIALGIACASWNSPSFELWGFVAAMTSTLAQSALNVFSKRAINKTGVRGPGAQRAMVAVGLLLAMVGTAVQHLTTTSKKSNVDHLPASSSSGSTVQESTLPPAWLGGAAVLAYHIEYVLSFMFVRLVQPITYGTCDAMRRLSIILSGQVMFGGAPFTHLNIFGIALALLGAVSYSIATSLK